MKSKVGDGMANANYDRKSVEKKKMVINVLSILGLVLAIIFLIYGIRTGIFKSEKAMAAFLSPFGMLTPVIYIVFIAFQSTFMVVPGALGNLVGVLLFGPFYGIICNYIGTILGSSANFALARYYGPDIIRVFSSEKGFKKAAENIEHPSLKTYFKSKAEERYNFGHELKSEIRNFGEEPDKGSSFAGDAHRTWMNLKTSLSSDKEEAVLEEAIRGEKASVEEYNEVLKDTNLPASTGNILTKQRDSITASLNKVKTLENRVD